jgi:hypothetical protein
VLHHRPAARGRSRDARRGRASAERPEGREDDSARRTRARGARRDATAASCRTW